MTKGESLLAAIEAFCLAHEMSETAFGRKAVNDGHLIRRLRESKSMTLKRLEAVEEFMAGYKAPAVVTCGGDPSSEDLLT